MLTDLHYRFLAEAMKRQNRTFEPKEVAAHLGISSLETRRIVDRLTDMNALRSEYDGIFTVSSFGGELLDRWIDQQQVAATADPISTMVDDHVKNIVAFAQSLPNVESNNAVPPEPDAAYTMLQTLLPVAKWGQLSFVGQVIRTSDISKPGTSVDDLIRREVIRPATADEVRHFDARYGESPEHARSRNDAILTFKIKTKRRTNDADTLVAKAALFLELMNEWQEADSLVGTAKCLRSLTAIERVFGVP